MATSRAVFATAADGVRKCLASNRGRPLFSSCFSLQQRSVTRSILLLGRVTRLTKPVSGVGARGARLLERKPIVRAETQEVQLARAPAQANTGAWEVAGRGAGRRFAESLGSIAAKTGAFVKAFSDRVVLLLGRHGLACLSSVQC